MNRIWLVSRTIRCLCLFPLYQRYLSGKVHQRRFVYVQVLLADFTKYRSILDPLTLGTLTAKLEDSDVLLSNGSEHSPSPQLYFCLFFNHHYGSVVAAAMFLTWGRASGDFLVTPKKLYILFILSSLCYHIGVLSCSLLVFQESGTWRKRTTARMIVQYTLCTCDYVIFVASAYEAIIKCHAVGSSDVIFRPTHR